MEDNTQKTEEVSPESLVAPTEEQVISTEASGSSSEAMTVQGATAAGGNVPVPPRPMSTKERKLLKAHNKRVASLFKQYRQEGSRRRNALRAELKAIKKVLGKSSFAALKDMATANIPEQKNEAGEVIRQATTQTNWRAVIQEGRNLISILRAERTALKQRKATTGRRSDRRRNNALVAHLMKRNEKAKEEEIKKSHEIK